MSVRGWAQGAAWEPLGSELVADAASGSTVLTVDWVGQFDDEGGSLSLNGVTYTYSAGGIDEDAATITLDTATVADAATDDPVLVVSGGQILSDLVLHVSCGDGDDIEVVVPFTDRDLWPEGDYDDPVQVIVSDDLERIIDVPGRTPARDGAYVVNPLAMGYLPTDISWPDNSFDTIDAWTVYELEDITYDAGTGKFTIHTEGLYDIRMGVTFDVNTSGTRAVRPAFDNVLFGGFFGRMIRIGASTAGTTGVETAQIKRCGEGEQIWFQAHQSSGAALDLRGLTGFSQNTTLSIVRIAP